MAQLDVEITPDGIILLVVDRKVGVRLLPSEIRPLIELLQTAYSRTGRGVSRIILPSLHVQNEK